MAPEVSPEVRTIHAPTAEGLQTPSVFVVDLQSDAPFDGTLFDDQVRRVSKYAGDKGAVKFVVTNNQMIVFLDNSGMHGLIYKFSFSVGITGEPQCAGVVEYNFARDALVRRKISGYSTSLEEDGLSPEESNRFKHTVLAEKLGEHFTIE